MSSKSKLPHFKYLRDDALQTPSGVMGFTLGPLLVHAPFTVRIQKPGINIVAQSIAKVREALAGTIAWRGPLTFNC